MFNIIIIFVVLVLGSFIQSVTGFGCAILVMAILPIIIPFKTAALVMSVAGPVLTFKVAFALRKSINYRALLIPFIASLVGRTIGVYILTNYDTRLLEKLLGGLLIALSLWFIFLNQKVKLKANVATGISSGLSSGLLGGMYNVGGPPLAVYYFSVLQDKIEYNATIQATFFLGGLYTVLLHIYYGNITHEVMRYSIIAVAGVIVGSSLGLVAFSKINKKLLSRLIYSFIMVMGIVMFR